MTTICRTKSKHSLHFMSNVVYCVSSSYSICIRQEEGFCCVQYFPCDDDNSFSLTNADPPVAGNTGSECSLDYIEINGKTNINF